MRAAGASLAWIAERIFRDAIVSLPAHHTAMETNHQLSSRQREILLWACRGKTYAEIGLIIGLAPGTIKTYLDQARYKLNVANLPQACAVAVVEGVFTREDIIPSRARTNTPEPPQSPPSDPLQPPE